MEGPMSAAASVSRPERMSVAVVGGGTMGVGIAYVSALAGHAVVVAEPDDARAAAADRSLRTAAAGAVKRGRLSVEASEALLARVRRVRAVDAVDVRPDVAIETVSERVELKFEVLRQIEALDPRLVCTNTSALSIDRLAGVLSEPSRFLGMHFFNPVWSFRLVELVRGAATSDESLLAAQGFVASIGKEFIVVRDVPGFATSRLDFAASLEAMRMLEDGVASAEDIDKAAVLAYHHPVGPLRLSDIVGLDVRLDIARVLEQTYGPRYAPPRLLIEKVALGELGQKSGQGFFPWPEGER
jgi:3-hydroxybutyryl-CoA dehydrogenase